MTIIDEFTEYGQFMGVRKNYLDKATIDQFIAENGPEFVSGYLMALESVAVDLAMILQPDYICGIPETPHMVRTNVGKYWMHNKSLIVDILNHIEPPANAINKPSL